MSSKVNFVNIPAELKQNTSFCVWKLEKRQGRPTKVPYNPKNGQLARTNDPSTFSDFGTAMKAYAMEQGVPEEDIFMDHAGFNTYDSIYRADYIFCVSRAIVVSQKDHLYRALYGCKKVGIDAKGVPAEGYEKYSQYYGNEYNVREYLARAKDFVKWIIKPEPKYLGDKIPIDGDGRQTEGD